MPSLPGAPSFRRFCERVGAKIHSLPPEVFDSRGNLNRLDENVLLRNWKPIFNQSFHVELNRLTDIGNPLFDGLALCVASRQGWTKHVVAAVIFLLEDDSKSMRCA